MTSLDVKFSWGHLLARLLAGAAFFVLVAYTLLGAEYVVTSGQLASGDRSTLPSWVAYHALVFAALGAALLVNYPRGKSFIHPAAMVAVMVAAALGILLMAALADGARSEPYNVPAPPSLTAEWWGQILVQSRFVIVIVICGLGFIRVFIREKITRRVLAITMVSLGPAAMITLALLGTSAQRWVHP
ncbi:hypothetical protein M2390_000644 [Mycetocola sp. BIGb0189]|uniref:hypothetical protein n=1 Tax=Mycetocola sp. BIGb0189 TaxID=2940604 RepID=UPI002166DBCB|nr:hypothetical protein [Mycetocola sp. BIGb0189]MCS4275483.1 hypothetical protein [Mycetocola sp. BIGb0189]